MKPLKITISGAAGQIGYALLFRLASGQAFGLNVPIELRLLEMPAAMTALHGVVMELEDCAFPLLSNVVATDDVNEAMKDANWVILVGAQPRKSGMERKDLLQVNGKIFAPQGKAINEQASDDVRVFVVGNPCNSNCLITMNHAPDVPKENFYAMTMLDENRARAQLAIKARVPVTAVKNIIIWGNHSSTQYPDFYHAFIDAKPTLHVVDDENWLQKVFIPQIQKRGAAVIEARGASSAASAANAVISSLRRLTEETVHGESYSVCSYSHGEYGVDEGLIYSFPSRTEKGRVVIQTGIEHNAFGRERLAATLKELQEEYRAIKELGLIK